MSGDSGRLIGELETRLACALAAMAEVMPAAVADLRKSLRSMVRLLPGYLISEIQINGERIKRRIDGKGANEGTLPPRLAELALPVRCVALQQSGSPRTLARRCRFRRCVSQS